jgi:hypothetical protein
VSTETRGPAAHEHIEDAITIIAATFIAPLNPTPILNLFSIPFLSP